MTEQKMVPVVPTEAMLDAALRLQGDDAFFAKAPALMSALFKIYTAMVKAAPDYAGEVVYQRLAQVALYGDVWFDISRETYEATKDKGITRAFNTAPPRVVVDEEMLDRAREAYSDNFDAGTDTNGNNYSNHDKSLLAALKAALEAK